MPLVLRSIRVPGACLYAMQTSQEAASVCKLVMSAASFYGLLRHKHWPSLLFPHMRQSMVHTMTNCSMFAWTDKCLQ